MSARVIQVIETETHIGPCSPKEGPFRMAFQIFSLEGELLLQYDGWRDEASGEWIKPWPIQTRKPYEPATEIS